MVCENSCNTRDACQGKMRYIQPARSKSCKPCVTYQRPVHPVSSDTVYKCSYLNLNSCDLARRTPIRPINILGPPTGIEMEQDTVTALSYPAHCNVARPKPIIPCPRLSFGQGPMQDLTTQKHDYVRKPICKRGLLVPTQTMLPVTGPLEKETIQTLSYQTPCNFVPSISCKPNITYQKPQMSMDVNTTQKLSFMPVCPQPKEDYPWARKAPFIAPIQPVEKNTTYKLSYLKNCAKKRPALCLPENNPGLITDNRYFEDNTVYKESYFETVPNERPTPIRPIPSLNINNSIKMDPNTVYKMTYPGHFCIEKQKPIRPCHRTMLGEGPMQDLTTQKHDFVPVPFSKRCKIVPTDNMCRVSEPIEKTTIARMSYANPDGFVPSNSCKPDVHYRQPNTPMDVDTTHKLSYMPVCPAPKESYPWAQKALYKAPLLPMDIQTVQQLSYPAPGHYVTTEGGCCVPQMCCAPADCCSDYPRAEVCY